MTTQPVFDPARSAAIRELLAETVATARPRPDRTKFAIITALTAVALALAGGTAALALTGVIRFGSPAPAPAPAPTTSVTPTPTPTPTPTASGPRVQVTSTVVFPHDVDSLPSQPRWSLDLPGIDDGCRMRPLEYDLSDGLAVFLTGTRPKEYEVGDCEQHRDEKIGLTLVDTVHGDVVWSRTWAFTSKVGSSNLPQFLILGTSGHALLDYGGVQSGPHDLIDLTTGKTISSFAPGAFAGAVSVPGTSGAIVVPTTEGRSGSTLTAIDPQEPDHPLWKTHVDNPWLQIADGTKDASTLPVAVVPESAVDVTYQRASVDLENGAIVTSPGNWQLANSMAYITLWTQKAADGATSYVAVDGSGAQLWTRTMTPGSFVTEVATPGTQPGIFGGRATTGQFAIVDRTSITVLDQLSGQVIWTASTAACGAKDFLGSPTVMVDPARNALSVRYSQDTACAFDRDTGRMLAGVGIPFDDFTLFGLTNTYVGTLGADKVAAYDNVTGRMLWSLPQVRGQELLFAGGYLVRTSGNHVESVG